MDYNMDKTKKNENGSSNENAPPSSFKHYLNTCQTHNVSSVTIAIISVTVIALTALNERRPTVPQNNESQTPKPKTFRAYGRNYDSGYLSNVFLILDRLGYVHDPHATNWDLLWAHDYPFRALYSNLSRLRPNQKVNHFPGCGFITNKVDLATSGLKYIPRAFKLPDNREKLLEYVADNPDKKFVQKNNDHRNIKLKTIESVRLDEEGTFIQEYVDNPLLVSGYKFDIGVYTIITSVDPLRIYIYNGDALLRFCPVKYYPFDPDNLDKYVVGDDYLPTWGVPDLTYYYETLGFGMKESLNAYLKSVHKNPLRIWEQIEEAITITVLAKEPQIVAALNRFPSKRNFYEMMRFDFVVDNDLNVYLMEANMSPNLSSAHFPPNKLLFEQVIYNLLSLIGLARRLKDRDAEADEMLTADKNLAVFAERCASVLCRSSCVSPDCQLCRPCVSEETRAGLVQAYREHVDKGDCKRIFPPTMDPQNVDLSAIEDYSPENQLQYRWFLGKCQQDSSWC